VPYRSFIARSRLGVGGLLVAACSGPPSAGRQLGDDLGTFHVEASESHNTCGAGTLGMLPRFGFDVQLSRADSELFWDARIGGKIDPALEFELSARVSVSFRMPRGRAPGCAVRRDDHISGRLRADGEGAITGFTGVMQYDFAPEPPSDCTLEDQLTAGLATLPCSMSYGLTGDRTRLPETALEGRADLD
jgi:hypothetical protein